MNKKDLIKKWLEINNELSLEKEDYDEDIINDKIELIDIFLEDLKLLKEDLDPHKIVLDKSDFRIIIEDVFIQHLTNLFKEEKVKDDLENILYNLLPSDRDIEELCYFAFKKYSIPTYIEFRQNNNEEVL